MSLATTAGRRAGDRGAVHSSASGAASGGAATLTGQEFPDESRISSFVGLYYDRGAVIPMRCCCRSPSRNRQAGMAAKRRCRPRIGSTEDGAGRGAFYAQRGPRQAGRAWRTKRRGQATPPPIRPATRRTRSASCSTGSGSNSCRGASVLRHLARGSFTVASRVVGLRGRRAGAAAITTFRVRSVYNDDFAAMYGCCRPLPPNAWHFTALPMRRARPSRRNPPRRVSPRTQPARAGVFG